MVTLIFFVFVAVMFFGFVWFLHANRKDRGLLKEVKAWNSDWVPLLVFVDGGVFTHQYDRLSNAVKDVVAFYSDAVGFTLFTQAGDIRRAGSVVALTAYPEGYKKQRFLTTDLDIDSETGAIKFGTIYVEEGAIVDVPYEDLVGSVAHEFGHLLGLDHDEITNSVMYPKSGKLKMMITDHDLALLKGLYQKAEEPTKD